MNSYAVTRAVRQAPEGTTLDLRLLDGSTLTGAVTADSHDVLTVTAGGKRWQVAASSVVAVGRAA